MTGLSENIKHVLQLKLNFNKHAVIQSQVHQDMSVTSGEVRRHNCPQRGESKQILDSDNLHPPLASSVLPPSATSALSTIATTHVSQGEQSPNDRPFAGQDNLGAKDILHGQNISPVLATRFFQHGLLGLDIDPVRLGVVGPSVGRYHGSLRKAQRERRRPGVIPAREGTDPLDPFPELLRVRPRHLRQGLRVRGSVPSRTRNPMPKAPGRGRTAAAPAARRCRCRLFRALPNVVVLHLRPRVRMTHGHGTQLGQIRRQRA
mmetsp:Transcript_38799/g.116655  ORF Transcript_38799/g.116655 Transcript_38799/m.116655 type:complete len:261 (+) Transcript_38799:565-1347(+)